MSKQKRILGFTALAIAMFIGTLDSTIINIALPDIMNYFKTGLNDTSWISTIYVLGLSVFMIPASKIADQFGRKKIMLIGLVLFGGSSALCGLSTSLYFLITMRLFQGIGGAIITPIVIPMALELCGREKTQTVASLIGAVTALAAAGGPPLGGILIKYINWQSIFFVNVPFALTSFILIIFFVGESYDKTISKSIDWIGILFLTSTLFLLTFSLLKGRDFGWGSKVIISMFIGSALSFILFIITEAKVKAPVVELKLFKEYTFTASSICYLITGFGIVGPLLIFNYYLQNALCYEALSAAYIVMAVSLTVIVAMPLGSVIAGKLGARPVNFSGVLCMGLGTLLLSRLTANISKAEMVVYMIIFGFGLGFSCQSLVSSIKYLPEDKSGIGSGIVNAARQIGTCLGIALLVSVLNSNVAAEKNNIKNDAVASINNSAIEGSVKKVIIQDINESYSCSGNDTGTDQKRLKNKLTNDIMKAVACLSSMPSPNRNDAISKLYERVSTLNDGTGKTLVGQKNLSNGIGTLLSSLGTLQNGGETLTSGINLLNDGLSKAYNGAQTLDTESTQGLGKMSYGINQISNGMQKLILQFSPGNTVGTYTIYDGVNGIASGTGSLSLNLNNYITEVSSTYYFIIKNDPTSGQMLKIYNEKLNQAQEIYMNAPNDTIKEQYKQQILMLRNIVTLYTVGTDERVTNEQQFETELLKLASQNQNNQNIVASGIKLNDGAISLSKVSKQVSAQFCDGGTFKEGMEQISNSMLKLNESSSGFSKLQAGISTLSSALSKLQDGSKNLADGSKKLEDGIISAKNGTVNLLNGSNQLENADEKIKDGSTQLTEGVGLIGQKNEIQNVVNKINIEKDDKIAEAFQKTFLLSSIILIAASVCGIFTDKKIKN